MAGHDWVGLRGGATAGVGIGGAPGDTDVVFVPAVSIWLTIGRTGNGRRYGIGRQFADFGVAGIVNAIPVFIYVSRFHRQTFFFRVRNAITVIVRQAGRHVDCFIEVDVLAGNVLAVNMQRVVTGRQAVRNGYFALQLAFIIAH